jgi:hypothetical protein
MEAASMARRSKLEYLRIMWQRYQYAGRAERSALLDEVTRLCGYHRKYAIGLLNRRRPPQPRPRRVPRRRPIYGAEAISVLAWIWEQSGYLCATRLKAALPIWLPWVQQRRPVSRTVARELLAISPRQIDRRLQARKHRLKRRLYGTTRPGTLLTHLVPLKTDHWDVTQPGYLEIDLVSHSGASASGDFLHTLDAVDIHTGWVERQAVRGKGQHGILQALTRIEAQLPFALRGLDSDNGSEFINSHLVAFCQRPGNQAIQFTRSRPYKKDDQAHVEQKNWTHVRKLLGWDRYDTPAAQQALNALYADLRLFQNLFQPSMKLQCKERRGSRLLRRYDRPQTPFERVRACATAEAAKVAALARALTRTDPFVLAQRIAQHLERVASLRSRAPQPASRLGARWRGWTFSPRAPQSQPAFLDKSAHTVGLGSTIGMAGKSVVGTTSSPSPVSRPGKNFR